MFDSNNPVIVSFLPFSGGKFLMNCLSLSKNCCPQDPSAAEYLIHQPNDYDYRLKTVLKTLPPRNEIHNWRSFELGDLQIYGDSFLSWKSGIRKQPNFITQKLCASNMRFFISDHSMEPIDLSQVWENSTIVRLTNSRKFQNLCLSKKNTDIVNDISQVNGNYCVEKYNILRGPDWPDWEEFQSCGYDAKNCRLSEKTPKKEIGDYYRLHCVQNQVISYDVDQNYFEIDKFLVSIQDLYKKLNLPDFSPDLVKFFYEKYISLHF